MKKPFIVKWLWKAAALLFILFSFLLLTSGITSANITSSYAYPPPAQQSNRLEPTVSPYPAPDNNIGEVSSSQEVAYPAPSEPTQPTQNNLENIILPKDKIVAISRNGELIDFNSSFLRYSNLAKSTNGEVYVAPTLPKGQASITPLSIIGGDDRFQILDTKVFPWTTVVKIQGHFTQNEVFSCTGWMLGKSTVVTAGHCIYDAGATNLFAFDVTFTPAYNTDDSNQRPFGSCQLFDESVLSPWFNSGDPAYDYGVYKIACRVGEKTGNLGFKTIVGDGIGTSVAVTGYPGDKGGATMWASIGTISNSNDTSFFYDNDTNAGQSGAPVWDYLDQNCHLCVVAVHTNGVDTPEQLNHGPRINDTMFNYFLNEQQFVINQVFLPVVMNQ